MHFIVVPKTQLRRRESSFTMPSMSTRVSTSLLRHVATATLLLSAEHCMSSIQLYLSGHFGCKKFIDLKRPMPCESSSLNIKLQAGCIFIAKGTDCIVQNHHEVLFVEAIKRYQKEQKRKSNTSLSYGLLIIIGIIGYNIYVYTYIYIYI